MAWLSHFGGLGWGNFDWVELRGIGIAPGVFRTVVRVSRETYPPICPLLLDNNIWLGNDLYYVNRTNVRRTYVPEHMF